MNSIILRLLAQRIALALLSLLAVSVVVFAITAVLPGDAAQEQLGQEATPEALAALRAKMGLDVPAPQRYVRWLGGLVTGNPGVSSATQLPVAELIGSRLPNSLAAGRGDGVVLGSHRAVARDRGRGVARLLVRPRRIDRRGRDCFGARIPGRNACRARVRGAAALAAGALVRQRHRIAGPIAAGVRDAGADAMLRDRRADDAHEPCRSDRPAGSALHRDGASEGRVAAAHRAGARASQRGRSHRRMRSRSACRVCSVA